jgi:hypothetical protein
MNETLSGVTTAKIADSNIVRVHIDNIKPNPCRDLKLFPIREQQVDGLVESIEQTGLWTSITARFEGAVTQELHDAAITKCEMVDGTLINPTDQDVELWFAHHRVAAARKCGFEWIDISMRPAGKELMLKSMANENKGDWRGGSYVLLETVRQVKAMLMEDANSCETFKDYQEKGLGFFNDSSAFKKGKKQIGFKNIHKFLGETWQKAEIGAAANVLEDIENGLYEQELVLNVPSVGLLGEFSALAKVIMKEDNPWPDFFKDKQLNDIAGLVCDPAVSTTIKIMRGAKAGFKDGNNPFHYIKTGNTKKFELVAELKKLVYKNPDSDWTPEDLLEVEGLKDYEGLAELVEQVKTSIQKSLDAEARAADKAAGAGTSGEVLEGEVDPMNPIGDIEDAINAAEAEAAVGTAGVGGALDSGDLGSIGEVSDMPEDAPLAQLTERFVQSSSVMAMQAKRLQGADIPKDELYSNALQDLLLCIIDLSAEDIGIDATQALVDTELAKYEEDTEDLS